MTNGVVQPRVMGHSRSISRLAGRDTRVQPRPPKPCVTEGGTRPAECSITMNPPHCLHEPWTDGGWEPKNREYSQEELLDEQQVYRYGSGLAQITESRNLGRGQADKAEVFSAQKLGNGQVLIVRGETPFEARIRLQNQDLRKQIPLSFHSGIPANPEHSRRVLAFDVAVGAGRSVDDLEFYAYLCRVADWRLDWENTRASYRSDAQAEEHDGRLAGGILAFYLREEEANRQLIDDTSRYKSSYAARNNHGAVEARPGAGVLPAATQEMKLPQLVVSQTTGDQHSRTHLSHGYPDV